MLPTGGSRPSGGGDESGPPVEALVTATSADAAASAARACWEAVEAGSILRPSIQAVIVRRLAATSPIALWTAHEAGLAPLDAVASETGAASTLASIVAHGLTTPDDDDAAARMLAYLIAAVHAPATGPAGPKRAAGAGRVLGAVATGWRTHGAGGLLLAATRAAVAYTTPRHAAGAWVAVEAAMVVGRDATVAGTALSIASALVPPPAADRVLPLALQHGAVGAAAAVATRATMESALSAAVAAVTSTKTAGALAASAAVVAELHNNTACTDWLAAARGADRAVVKSAVTASMAAAWLMTTMVEGAGAGDDEPRAVDEPRVFYPQPSHVAPSVAAAVAELTSALDDAGATAASARLVSALAQSDGNGHASLIFDAATTAWVRVTRGGRWGAHGARWLQEVVSAASNHHTRALCRARLFCTADAASVAGAAAWALCDDRDWLEREMARVPRGRVSADAAVAAAAALAVTCGAFKGPGQASASSLVPVATSDLLSWAASGRASRTAADVAAAALRRTPATSPTPLAMWRLEAAAAIAGGWDERAGRAALSASGLGSDVARRVLGEVGATVVDAGLSAASAAAAAAALTPLAVEAAKGDGWEAWVAGEGKGAALCARLLV